MASSDLYSTLGYMPNVYHPQRPLQLRDFDSMASYFRDMGELEVYHHILRQISKNISLLAYLKNLAKQQLRHVDQVADAMIYAVAQAIEIDVTHAIELDSIQYSTMRDVELSGYTDQVFGDLPLCTRNAWTYDYLISLGRRNNSSIYFNEWVCWLLKRSKVAPVSQGIDPPDAQMSYTDAEAACMAEFSDKTEREIFETLTGKISSSQNQLWNLHGTLGTIRHNPYFDQEALAFDRKVTSCVQRGLWRVPYIHDDQAKTKLKDLSTSTQSTWIKIFVNTDATVKEVEGLTAWWNNLPRELKEPAMDTFCDGMSTPEGAAILSMRPS